MKIKVEEEFFNIFPQANIGLIISKGITNISDDMTKYETLLEQAKSKAKEHMPNPEFAQNEVIAKWREAYRKFKIKKGVRSSIEALLKRVENGKGISSISPLVDVYNSVSLEYAVPCGGEDLDCISGDMLLTVAEGGEDFITLGSEQSEPALEGEVVYKDNEGIICRCWNWREAVRTMLTEKTQNAVFVIETVDDSNYDNFKEALATLENRLKEYIGGEHTIVVLNKENDSYEF